MEYKEIRKGYTIVSNRYMRDTMNDSKESDKEDTLAYRDMKYEEISRGGLTTRMSIRDLFSNLGKVQYENDGFFYISFFCYLVLGLSLFNVYNKRILILLTLAVSLFLLSLAEASPLHRFLYDHILIFRLFRNLYYFLPYILACVILLTVEQFRILLTDRFFWVKRPLPLCLAIFFIHVIFLTLLIFQDNVIKTTFITLALSLFFFTKTVFFGKSYTNFSSGVVLLLLIILQPMEALGAYNRDANAHYAFPVRVAVLDKREKPSFSFVRPLQRVERYDHILDSNTPNYFFGWARLSLQDFPGFITYRCGFPTFWSFYLFENYKEEIYRQYVRNKFLIYDTVQILENDITEKGKIEDFFRTGGKRAFVCGLTADQKARFQREQVDVNKKDKESVVALKEDSPLLQVVGFNVNGIKFKTNFPDKKFLVYNDSYYPYWLAKIDNASVDLYRTNLTFKGLWIPSGERTIELTFSVPGGEGLYFSVLGILFLFYGWGFLNFWQRSYKHP